MSETVGAGINSESQQNQENPWDSLKNQPMRMTFQVAPGVTKEEEFKRLTGEDWPGKKYKAETYGADDDGYDYPIETWIITERQEEKQQDPLIGKTFQVAPGVTKEEEFKRLTGEDWPGKKYMADTYGVDDDGYDYPIETWKIRERTPEPEPNGATGEGGSKPDDNSGNKPNDNFDNRPNDNSGDNPGGGNQGQKPDEKQVQTQGQMQGDKPDKKPEDGTMSEDDWQEHLRRMQEEPRDEFAGERNINDGTGKKRSFVEFDRYPRMKGETPEEYGKRLRRMHEMTAEYLEQEKEKDKDGSKESYYERMKKKIREHEGLTDEHKKNLEDLLNRKFKDKGKEQDKDKEAEKQKELERARQKEKEKARARLIEERKKIDERIEEIDRKLGEPEPEKKPLVAVNADFTLDKKDLAHDLAERNLNDEVAGAKGLKGAIKRMWKGTLFKKYYEQKYTREFMEGERSVKIDGEEFSLNDLMQRRKDGAIERFVLSVVEDSEQFIHKKAGEEMTEADAEVTAEIRDAISRFATAQNISPEDRKREFREELARIRAEHRDKGQQVDEAVFDNYEQVAEQAFERVSHGMAIDDVMDGFKVYNAKARDGARTEAHRDAVDKLVNKVESSFFGRFIPAEALAAGCGIASALTQTGVRAVAGAAGGILASGIISGLKERNRITEDRARMMRDAAEGMSYEDGDRQVGKRTEKYETRIGGTLYDMRPASELAANLDAAMKMEGEGRSDAVLRAIAEARVRTDFSDAESKDLISYSSAEKRGDERLALDKALIQAEKSLSAEDQKKLEVLKKQVYEEISEKVDESDKDFKKMRAHMAAKKAGKTILIGAATFVVSQEVMAAIDPGKVGILEKAGILKTQNASGAKETVLAKLFRDPTRTVKVQDYHVDTIEDISGDRTTEIEAYEKAGYQKVETSPGWSEVKPEMVEVKPSESTAAIKVKVDGWANNGTSGADGNELRVHYDRGTGTMISRMRGNSTMGGRTLNYESLAAEGKVKGILYIGGSKFELASKVNESGQLVWGENGVFTTTTGETIRGVSESGKELYKFFQVVVDNGVDEDGVHHVISLATDRGTDSFTGTMQQIGETIIEHPATYSFVKTTVTEVPRVVTETAAVTTAGIAFGPETARTGLGGPAGSIVGGESPNNPNGPTEGGASGENNAGEQGQEGSGENNAGAGGAAGNTEANSGSSQGETQDDNEKLEFSDHTRGELKQFSQEMRNEIEANKELIGQESVDILTDTAKLSTTTGDRYRSWWSSLSDEQKTKVSELVRKVYDSDMSHDLEWGVGFRTWYLINVKM